ncbi:MAG: TonB-dependent receptor [Rhodocyclaceae bacterium]|nr:TonB-dependent receptor [Rhodocyclaceae bacterium]
MPWPTRARRALPLLGIVAASSALAAMESDDNPFLEPVPVVLTVSRLSQPLAEAPAAVTVLDRELILRSGARTLAEVLRLVPGFLVASNEYGAPVATYHGPVEEFPQGMQVLVDGRSQYSPTSLGGVNWSGLAVTLEEIERIEVTRGSNSAAYGSNAFLGIVNVITRDPSMTHGVGVTVTEGQGGIEDRLVSVGGHVGAADVRLVASSNRDEGLPAQFDSLRQRHLNLRAGLQLTDRDRLTISAGRLRGNLAIEGTPNSGTNPPRDPRPIDQNFAQIDWLRALDADTDLLVRYHQVEDFGGEVLRLSVVPATLDFRYHSRRHDFESQLTTVLSPTLRVVGGLGHRVDRFSHNSDFYGMSDPYQRVSRLFGSLEWQPADDWRVNAAATWEDDSNSETTLAPRLALHRRVAPGQWLRAGVSRAYRTPSLFEQVGRTRFQTDGGELVEWVNIGRGDLRPEQLDTAELGYVANFPALRSNLDVRLARERTTRGLLSVSTPVPPELGPDFTDSILSTYNGFHSTLDSLELQWRWQPLAGTRLILNHTAMHMEGGVSDTVRAVAISPAYLSDISTQVADSVPAYTSSLIWLQDLPGGLRLTAIYRSVGAMRWTPAAANSVHAYETVDWNVQWPFSGGWGRGEVAVGVLSDSSSHAEFRRDEGVDRRAYATLRLAL